tara:strand:+ start:4280 stop:4807 length:528 start_codon:yes stop_codon:yes gene_type:complete
MTSAKRSIFLALFFLVVNTSTSAQFINLNINIEPELSVTVEQNLNFGTLVANSGLHNIPLGAINSGVYSIRAYHTQNIYITLNSPDFLINESSNSTDRIPITLNAAFNNSGVDNQKLATTLENNTGYFPVHKPSSSNLKTDVWQALFLYMFGTIDVGNIANGIYSGQVVLFIEYD